MPEKFKIVWKAGGVLMTFLLTIAGAPTKVSQLEGRLGILVTGTTEFTSVLKLPESNQFEGILSCGLDKTEFHYTIS